MFVCVFTSICLWHNVWDVTIRDEGEVEYVGGVVLAGQGVKDLAVNSHLDVVLLCVTHLTHKHIINTLRV